MPKKARHLLTDNQIAKNPAVDPKVVKEALQMRRELEKLGVWEDRGSRVRNPFEPKPALKQRGEGKSRLITQNQSLLLMAKMPLKPENAQKILEYNASFRTTRFAKVSHLTTSTALQSALLKNE